MVSKFIGGVALAVAMLAQTPAQAASFVLTSSTNSALSGTAGLASSPITVAGITMTATAWSTGTLTDLPVAAYLGTYVNGLGVTNGSEGNGQSLNSHTIDNVGSYDFVRLVFSAPVKLTGLSLYGYDVDGSPTSISTDAWVSYGSTGFGTSALWQGYLDRGTTVTSGSPFSSTNVGTVWLVGAARTSTSRNDGFKLNTVQAVAAVPEPATWAMLICGFGIIGGVLRRRRTAGRLVGA